MPSAKKARFEYLLNCGFFFTSLTLIERGEAVSSFTYFDLSLTDGILEPANAILDGFIGFFLGKGQSLRLDKNETTE